MTSHSHTCQCSHSDRYREEGGEREGGGRERTHTLSHAGTLTPIMDGVESVIVVVVLVMVLQSGGAAGTQLSQPAAGGAELRA